MVPTGTQLPESVPRDRLQGKLAPPNAIYLTACLGRSVWGSLEEHGFLVCRRISYTEDSALKREMDGTKIDTIRFMKYIK